ncbi:GAF and ANTAR domain-containing protein [Nocardia sp. XZ_19_385]|uniref:GAF and ANTAR domain-containing protein n=1 Tax=Nocardia sp. XZ_19_385 TaxID=2769488 RepID=UPI00188F1382|nr:GAF and ANTAR domain-containing protein [Nocardia sp. XZ_19_385]
MESREGPLVDAFVRLADTLVADYDVVELCQELVEGCVRLLDAAQAGLLLADHRGTLQVLASTSEQTHLLELFQLESDHGPCLQAYDTGTPVLVDDLSAAAGKWPEFVRRGEENGYRSVYALPLRLRTETIGALNLFGATRGALVGDDLRVAQALADVACIGVLQHRILNRAETLNSQLRSALNSRIIIEQAKGVLAERGHLDMDQAFKRLRDHARSNNIRLVDLSNAVVTGAVDSESLLDGMPGR